MTVIKAKHSRPSRRPLPIATCAIGLAVGLYAAGASALPVPAIAAGMGQSATGAMADPAKRTPDAVTVSAIDFKRGDGGSGKLILRFNGDGAAPDLRNSGSNVVVDIGNAQVPAALQRPMNVADFAAALGVTPTHLTRCCNTACGRPASALLQDRRIFEARKLLAETRIPVGKIAEQLGFNSPAYFTRAFQHLTGKSPSAFRRAGV